MHHFSKSTIFPISLFLVYSSSIFYHWIIEYWQSENKIMNCHFHKSFLATIHVISCIFCQLTSFACTFFCIFISVFYFIKILMVLIYLFWTNCLFIKIVTKDFTIWTFYIIAISTSGWFWRKCVFLITRSLNPTFYFKSFLLLHNQVYLKIVSYFKCLYLLA